MRDPRRRGTVDVFAFEPAQQGEDLHPLTRAEDLAVAGSNLLDQAGAGAWHADDKDRRLRRVAPTRRRGERPESIVTICRLTRSRNC